MIGTRKKELIIEPKFDSTSELKGFIDKIENITLLKINPTLLDNNRFQTIYESADADFIICRSIEEMQKLKSTGKKIGYYKKIANNSDIDELERISEIDLDFIIVDAYDWKIIPLENIIARFHTTNTKIFTTAKNSNEVLTMFTVLEIGVDGVILTTSNLEEIKESQKYLDNKTFDIKSAEVIHVSDAGIGERVCVDTVSILEEGEGMLVGSKSNFLFLIHNESFGSSFTSPRPFRVNAGAVYCYTLTPTEKTKYLSELEGGQQILIVNKKGISRSVSVGRSKIETRPLKLIKAKSSDGFEGTVIVQNAETIQFIGNDGKLIPVTEIKNGDQILCYYKQVSGRHFGIEVQEFNIKK